MSKTMWNTGRRRETPERGPKKAQKRLKASRAGGPDAGRRRRRPDRSPLISGSDAVRRTARLLAQLCVDQPTIAGTDLGSRQNIYAE